jgi:DNA-binding MarR family transcriptional regulator
VDHHGHDSLGYLLVQLGTAAARLFAEELAPLGLEPRQAGMLFRLAAHQGQSQQALGDLIGLNSTRMVFLVDELEERGLVERRRNEADRRSHALYLTEAGWAAVHGAGQAAARQESLLSAPLDPAERAQLAGLLRRLAEGQGLTERALPG